MNRRCSVCKSDTGGTRYKCANCRKCRCHGVQGYACPRGPLGARFTPTKVRWVYRWQAGAAQGGGTVDAPTRAEATRICRAASPEGARVAVDLLVKS